MTVWSDLFALLERHEVPIEPGLSAAEVRAIEADYLFRFPPDLRAFLMTGLPIPVIDETIPLSYLRSFIDWRHGKREHILERLAWPLHDVEFAIKQQRVWLDEWGERPADRDAAVERGLRAFAAAPRLIPIYAHRFIPATPHESDNPVFSVYGIDIIHYGRNLADYVVHEFVPRSYLVGADIQGPFKVIPFWSGFIEQA